MDEMVTDRFDQTITNFDSLLVNYLLLFDLSFSLLYSSCYILSFLFLYFVRSIDKKLTIFLHIQILINNFVYIFQFQFVVS